MPSLPSAGVAALAAALIAICIVPASARITVGLDTGTGALSSVRHDGAETIAAPGTEVEVHGAGAGLGDPSTWQLTSVRGSGTGSAESRRRAGSWEITSQWDATGDLLRHRVRLRWTGPAPVTVRGVTLVVPNLRLSPHPNDVYCIPGNFPISWQRASDLVPGATVAEAGWTRGEYGMALLHSPSARRFAVAAYEFAKDQARVSVVEGRGAVSIRHHFDAQAQVAPGSSLDVGAQVLLIGRGDVRRLQEQMGRLSDSLGNGPPADQPEHLRRLALYQAHPWGRLETWPGGDRGNRFPRLTAMAPYLRDLGITGVWLLPVSWPPPWVYTLPEFGRVAPENGTSAELREFVRTAQRLGIKVLADLVVYGVHPDSPEIAKLPDAVWSRNEAGERVRVWGGVVLAADCSHPAWQARIAEVCRAWARDYGFDGARLDCIGWGQTQNWAHPTRANAAIAYGGLQLNKVVRDAFRQVNPNAVTLPEGGKPLVFRHADMVFGYPLYMAMRDMTTTPRLADWVARLREWLEWERHAYPARARRGLVRFLENHDTVAAAEFFGVGPSQALMAICALMQGVPLVYQEQEIGFSADLAAWLHLRKSEPSFYAGEADYDAVTASNAEVLAFLREHSTQAAVVAVNMTGRPVDTVLRWPAGVGSRFPVVVDALRGGRIRPSSPGAARVRIEPYRPVVLLMLPQGGRPRYQPRRPVRSQRTVLARPGPDGALRIDDAVRWRVETGEGTLEDAFRTFHARLRPGEPITALLQTLRPAWDPLSSGLLDGSHTSAIEITRRDGTAVRVEADPRRLRGLSIDDPAGDGRRVTVRVDEDADRGRHPPGPGAVSVRVEPQWVRITAPGCYLVLSRRRGGAIAHFGVSSRDRSVVGAGADAYSDNGIFAQGVYASCDGEATPRLTVEHLDDGIRVTFRGTLRARSWNGVQACPVAQPACAYRLTYEVDRWSRVTVTLGITPSLPVPDSRAFVGYRLPLPGVTGWSAGALRSGRPGTVGERVLTMHQAGDAPRVIRTRRATLRVAEPAGLQNVFLIPDAAGESQLFLALLDGAPHALEPGREVSGSVVLELAPAG
ncbi:MAG TPA: alpha-amylase family glycosyl hydrolase [Chthonomonadales bacterium]|nr:alpha-amylase family glycosyl hydrolase [Chthonomonadales bacterium]